MTSLAAIGEGGAMLGATIVVMTTMLSVVVVRHGRSTRLPAVTTAGSRMGCLQKPPMRKERKEDDMATHTTHQQKLAGHVN